MVEVVKHCNRFSGVDMDLQNWKSLRTDETKIYEVDITGAELAMA